MRELYPAISCILEQPCVNLRPATFARCHCLGTAMLSYSRQRVLEPIVKYTPQQMLSIMCLGTTMHNNHKQWGHILWSHKVAHTL